MLSADTIGAIARRLYEAEKTRTLTRQVSLEHPGVTIEDAYAIQRELVALKLADGRIAKGRKIGLTSKAMQYAVNIAEPDYGTLFDDMFFDDGGEVPAGRFIATRVEVELAFVLKAPLAGPSCTIFDVLNATDFVVPALEILDTRIHRVDPETGSTRKVMDTIADNAANAGIVLGGRPIRPLEVDLRWVGAIFHRNGQVEETGVAVLLTFRSGREVFVGLAEPRNSAMWPMGIPRLRFPREAPSRSTLKLEEAWHHFIPRGEWDKRLAPNMLAVDLGAAPGGWTWQLVNREMRVIAVDNGPMAENLIYSGLVDHQRADGYVFRPRQMVDWMVCDIVEKPARTGWLIDTWIGEGLCREAVVNLKLPMKQRYAEVRKILERLRESFRERGLRVAIGCKQLYHDREEVTVHLRRL